MPDVLLALLIGIGGGFLAGMFGIGGGAIFVPGLVLILDRPQHEAQGISLAVIIVTAFAGTLVHRHHGHIDGSAVLWVTPVAMLLGLAGGALANQLSAEALQRIFAVVLIALSTRMLYQAWRRPVEPPVPEPMP